MLAIKLQRIGKKYQPSYRVVVAEKKSKMAAPPIEDLGSYSSLTKKANLKAERVSYWLGVGAQPTVTMHNLLVREGAIKAPKIKMTFKVVPPSPEATASQAPKAAEPAPVAAAAAPAAEAPANAEPAA